MVDLASGLVRETLHAEVKALQGRRGGVCGVGGGLPEEETQLDGVVKVLRVIIWSTHRHSVVITTSL